MPATWTGDPAVWVQIEETLALLPIKRRRLLLNYWASGNIADATRRAGYDVKNVKSACEVGREILADPKVAWCTRAIFEAECGGAEKLRALLGVHAAGFDSPSEGDRDRSLRVASLIYKHGRPRPVPGSKSPLDQLFDEMSPAELRRFAERQEWPAWAADRLRRAGFSLRCRSGDPDDAGADAHPSAGTGHGEFGDADQEDDPGMAADDPPPAPTPLPPIVARAPDPSSRERQPGETWAEPAPWQRPEDRVFAPRRPAPEPPAPQPSTDRPAADPATEADAVAETKWMAALHARLDRDRVW